VCGVSERRLVRNGRLRDVWRQRSVVLHGGDLRQAAHLWRRRLPGPLRMRADVRRESLRGGRRLRRKMLDGLVR
jgi:hypothetical protein